MDYQNGKIYRIVCEETGRQYIGSTCSTLVKRLSNHKNNKKSRCACKDFINPKIFLIEDYPCDRKDQLLMKERYWIETMECVNLVRPIINELERKDTKVKCNSIYHQTHKEKIELYKSQKVKCECGSQVRFGNLPRHKKSKKHISNN